MRSIWTGAISFGLINIPVRLYTAVKDTRPDLDMLHKKDLSPIRYARVCKADGEEIPFSEIVKGYEYQKGDYVVLEDEDFKRANARKTQTIDIQDFVEEKEIDTKLLEKPYYLEPTKESRKAYMLLAQGLKKTGKIGVGKFVLRTREHLVALKPQDGMLVLDQMRFIDQIVSPEVAQHPQRREGLREGAGPRDQADRPADNPLSSRGIQGHLLGRADEDHRRQGAREETQAGRRKAGPHRGSRSDGKAQGKPIGGEAKTHRRLIGGQAV